MSAVGRKRHSELAHCPSAQQERGHFAGKRSLQQHCYMADCQRSNALKHQASVIAALSRSFNEHSWTFRSAYSAFENISPSNVNKRLEAAERQ